MNKKIKMIELLNMICRGELKDKTKFKVYSSCKDESDIPYICEYDKTEPGIIWCITSYDSKFNFKIDYMRILNYYVEILEDNTEEIDELPDYNYSIKENRDKINELVKRINYIERKINDN
ncbi:MAG: hypothetical protein IJK18_08250 [Clostridia bacterium]|nr:hypothetical protein [Clostridia bacterium]